jgi:hypothetical protein
MKNVFSKILLLSLFAFAFGGCNAIQKVQEISSNSANVEDKTRDTLGLKKTGIAECDEVVEILTRKSKGNKNPEEESWQDRAMTELVKQQIYNYINDPNANKSPKERTELTEKCKTALGFLR